MALECRHTHACHTEKVNPFYANPKLKGGWAKPKSFPLGYHRFEMYMQPVTYIFVIYFFQRYLYICNAIFLQCLILCAK